MLEKFIKRDNNEELEKILEEKQVEEQAKNLLLGILYKIEVSYRDYKKAKVTPRTQKQYVEEILRNIERKAKQIKIVKLTTKLADEKIQKELEEKKFYVGDREIIAYPIEEKILYAIEKNSNNKRIVSNRYGISTMPISNIINIGKNLDRVEVLRDFNGWSWTTIKTEIESIKANLIYQTIRILLGEEFLDSWTQDVDGIIDYIQIMKEELITKYGEEITEKFIEKLEQIAIINEIEEKPDYKINVIEELKKIEIKSEEFKNTKDKVQEITNKKKKASKEIEEIEKILNQESKIQEEYTRRNKGVPLEKKIFSIKVLKQQLNDRKQQLLNEIEESNYLLNPRNYINEKNKIEKEKEQLEVVILNNEEKEQILIEFEKIFLHCFEQIVNKVNIKQPEEISKLIYQFRYYMLLPFNHEKNIKDVKQLEQEIEIVERKLMKTAIENKIIVDIPFEIMKHIFETRIIELEELYYKITSEFEKNYVQIFDENITEEKFEINLNEKTKINKKIKIFI